MRNELQVALVGIFVILCGRPLRAQQGFAGINTKFLPPRSAAIPLASRSATAPNDGC
jgi:hypothetical protein